MITLGADRWGMTKSFIDGGFECVFGDLMFGLSLPIALHSEKSLKRIAAIVMPIAGRLPFEWIYPTGEKQETRTPKWEDHYQWATVVAGDCHYVKRYMPESLDGKIVVTNTTTPSDLELFKETGFKYLVTSTPILDGRSFGTNMMEAALVAVAGKKRKLTHQELQEMLEQLDFKPQIKDLN